MNSTRAKEIGTRGGQRTLEKYGTDWFAQIGKKGFAVSVQKSGLSRALYLERLQRAGRLAQDSHQWNGAYKKKVHDVA